MLGLVSKIAGPRVLIGIVLVGLAAIGTLSYLLLDAQEEKGAAQTRAVYAEGANKVWAEAWSVQRQQAAEQQRLLNDIDQRLSTYTTQSQQRLDQLDRGLRDAIQNSEEVRAWASRRRPQPVLDRLCLAGYIDPAAREHVCGDSGAPDP